MIKCNNPDCGFILNWKDRYKICPKCGYIMVPHKKQKMSILTSKNSKIMEIDLEDLNGDQ